MPLQRRVSDNRPPLNPRPDHGRLRSTQPRVGVVREGKGFVPVPGLRSRLPEDPVQNVTAHHDHHPRPPQRRIETLLVLPVNHVARPIPVGKPAPRLAALRSVGFLLSGSAIAPSSGPCQLHPLAVRRFASGHQADGNTPPRWHGTKRPYHRLAHKLQAPQATGTLSAC